jgi:hypothetical protein
LRITPPNCYGFENEKMPVLHRRLEVNTDPSTGKDLRKVPRIIQL